MYIKNQKNNKYLHYNATVDCIHDCNVIIYFIDFTGDEILMKDEKGDIVLFNVKNLNTIVLANATTKVGIFKYFITYYFN